MKKIMILLVLFICSLGLVACSQEHQHTYGDYLVHESGHYRPYTCGCPQPEILEYHVDAVTNGICDICGYTMTIGGAFEFEYFATEEGHCPHKVGEACDGTCNKSPHEDLNHDMQCDMCGYIIKIAYTLSSELVEKLIWSIEQESICYDIAPYYTSNKIDSLTSTSTLYHIQFDGNLYYYACGYSDDNYDYDVHPENLEWYGYNDEKDIKKVYKDMDLKVVFKIDVTNNVFDVIKDENVNIKVEHINKIPLNFNENNNFIYEVVKYKNEFLYISQESVHIYFVYNDFFFNNKTLNFFRFEDDIYLYFLKKTERVIDYNYDDVYFYENDYSDDFGVYFEDLMSIITKEYVVEEEKFYNNNTQHRYYTYTYDLISIDNFKKLLHNHPMDDAAR